MALLNILHYPDERLHTVARPVDVVDDALRRLIDALQPPAFDLDAQGLARLRNACAHYLAASPVGLAFVLPGPTGESNRYRLLPREGGIWCMPQTTLGLLHQLAASLATGHVGLIEIPSPDSPIASWLETLPPEVKQFVRACTPAQRETQPDLSVVLFEGDADALARAQIELAQRDGPIVRMESRSPAQLAEGALIDLHALMHEQSVSINTAAAGGNAQLMTLA